MKKKVKLEFTKVLHVNIKSYSTVHDSCDSCVYVWFRIYLSIIPVILETTFVLTPLSFQVTFI